MKKLTVLILDILLEAASEFPPHPPTSVALAFENADSQSFTCYEKLYRNKLQNHLRLTEQFTES
jgi:hypothetical protein